MFRLIIINFIIFFIWVPVVRNALLKICGLNISWHSKIGLSLILTKNITLHENSSISHLNFIKCDSVTLYKYSTIGLLNLFKGSFEVILKESSHIGKANILKNNGLAVIPKPSVFQLGEYSKITAAHYIDMSCDVLLGDNCVLGGRNTLLWTHGFIHFDMGVNRLIKLEPIVIGNGVYIGSSCVINPATVIGDGINIGSGSSVSGSIHEPGLYISQKLRLINVGDLDSFLTGKVVDYNYKAGNVRFS